MQEQNISRIPLLDTLGKARGLGLMVDKAIASIYYLIITFGILLVLMLLRVV